MVKIQVIKTIVIDQTFTTDLVSGKQRIEVVVTPIGTILAI